MIEVGLVGWHAQVFIADQELSRSGHVLDISHRRSVEEVHFALWGEGIEVKLFNPTASEDPVWDISRVHHVCHVKHRVPKRGSLPHVFELRLADHVTRKEASMAATKYTKSLGVDNITELLKCFLCQVSTVLRIVDTDGAQERVKAVLTVADAAPEVDNEQAEALHEECVAPS